MTKKNKLINLLEKTQKFIWYLTWLAIPLCIAVLITGLVLTLGGVLAPAAVALTTNILLSVIIGFGTYAGVFLAKEIFGLFKQTFGSTDILTQQELKAQNKLEKEEPLSRQKTNSMFIRTALENFACTLAGLTAMVTFIALAATGIWLPVAMSVVGTVFTAIGTAVVSGFMFWDICDRFRDFCSIGIRLKGGSPKVTYELIDSGYSGPIPPRQWQDPYATSYGNDPLQRLQPRNAAPTAPAVEDQNQNGMVFD